MTDTLAVLTKGLEELGIKCSEDRLPMFDTYLLQLKKWNKTYNLTSLNRDADIVIKHFLDSLLYLKVIPAGALVIADLGSGAGFPGIPLKIARPELDITLIEPTGKKAIFLRHVVRELGLEGIQVCQERVENLGSVHLNHYDIMVTRATFGLKEYLERASIYIKPGGFLVVSKGPAVEQEIEDSGVQEMIMEILPVNLPVTGDHRRLISLSCAKISS
ncbi:MAG: 16S rRNA (guanine(527)-N(7))-methyltransferase RsmG [Nitrospira sp.]|nr:16S rRNA (guanine(527)-N(7))-methyltransferase RsmG [bacterium]MBL7048758.1 16S rRNA (guanine(527)-N(7))-methyltransferase RsmG [Nitrospira sp.]